MKIIASALINSIYVCFVAAVLCSAFLLIFSYQSYLYNSYESGVNLISENTSAFNYFLGHQNHFKTGSDGRLSVEGSMLNSQFKLSPWGLFETLTIKTYNNKDSISKTYLLASISPKDSSTLFIADLDQQIKFLTGVNIKGDIKVPGGSIKNQNGLNEAYHLGRVIASKKELPLLINGFILDKEEYEIISYEEANSTRGLNNSFKEIPIFIDLKNNNSIDNINLKGNIVLYSESEIVLKESFLVEDVIIYAPRVVIENNFNGSCQIFARESIQIKNNVKLLYPSVIHLESGKDTTSISIGENSLIEGAVILKNTSSTVSINNSIKLSEKSKVIGTIYCEGYLELKGNITGAIYSQYVFNSNPSLNSVELNALKDVKINLLNLPFNLFNFPLKIDYENSGKNYIKEVW